jgi:serine/threonine protein kinase
MDTINSMKKTTYSHTKEIGEGSYGSVLMVYNEEGECFAMKKFESVYNKHMVESLVKCLNIENPENNIEDEYITSCEEYDSTNTGSSNYSDRITKIPGMETGALREISILRCLSNILNTDNNYEHPNIITLTDICWYDGELSMIMPKMCMCLYDAVKSDSLNNIQKIKISHGLITAVGFLHTNNIIHRDIKTDNVLLDDDMSMKLCDFSLSKLFDDKMEETGVTHTPEVGTSTYRAPEQIWEDWYSFSADVWSIGVVILEMVNGIIKASKDKSAYNYIMDLRRKFGSSHLSKLLKSILQKDPDVRINCKEALKMELFKELPKSEFKKVLNKTLVYDKPKEKKKKVKINAASRRSKLKKSTTSRKIKKLNEYEKICEKFEFENPMTPASAEIYHKKTNENIIDCVLLASKMYEYYTIDIIEDVGNKIKDFDLTRYLESEKRILISMDYCLFI